MSAQISRRAMLQGATAFVIGACLPLREVVARTEGAAPVALVPNAFVRIGVDDTVTVIVKHIEMGQGPFTGLATLVAEELDADWSKVRAEHAPADVKIYNNILWGPVQGTGGSSAIANSYEQMRKMGAIARAMLVQAAANTWRVSASEITVDSGVIRHAKSAREGTFGEFVAAAGRLKPPTSDKVRLKDPASFKLIGKERNRRLDSAAKSNGTALYTIDIHEQGMLVAIVGEPGVPPIAPAVANAIARLQERPRRLPLVRRV